MSVASIALSHLSEQVDYYNQVENEQYLDLYREKVSSTRWSPRDTDTRCFRKDDVDRRGSGLQGRSDARRHV